MTDTKLPPRRKSRVRPLFDGSEWNFDLIRKTYDTMVHPWDRERYLERG